MHDGSTQQCSFRRRQLQLRRRRDRDDHGHASPLAPLPAQATPMASFPSSAVARRQRPSSAPTGPRQPLLRGTISHRFTAPLDPEELPGGGNSVGSVGRARPQTAAGAGGGERGQGRRQRRQWRGQQQRAAGASYFRRTQELERASIGAWDTSSMTFIRPRRDASLPQRSLHPKMALRHRRVGGEQSGYDVEASSLIGEQEPGEQEDAVEGPQQPAGGGKGEGRGDRVSSELNGAEVNVQLRLGSIRTAADAREFLSTVTQGSPYVATTLPVRRPPRTRPAAAPSKAAQRPLSASPKVPANIGSDGGALQRAGVGGPEEVEGTAAATTAARSPPSALRRHRSTEGGGSGGGGGQHVVTLQLARCHVTDVKAASIADSLRLLSSGPHAIKGMVALNLRNNTIADAGAKSIAVALEANRSVTAVDLVSNGC
jgi:hypothetical protein